jgi:hypothetical protein
VEDVSFEAATGLSLGWESEAYENVLLALRHCDELRS